MSALLIPRPRICRPYLILLALLLLAASGAAAERTPVWVPSSTTAEGLAETTVLYYDGVAGRLVGAGAGEIAGIVARGGQQLDVAEGDVLYVFLVEDAQRAAFEPPARVLLSAGHEVLVATPGDAPRLTPASARSLSGLKQPVRIDRSPIPWPAEILPPPSQPREADPLVQQMVNDLTTANYVASWQRLDDFETRYTYATQNEQATQWILDQFHSIGLSASFHYYQDGGQRRNVIATLPGIVDPAKVVYICGHLDATSDTPYTCAPGADDNASGTTAVIEAARVMSRYLYQYTIKFACFNGEEQGLLGSAAYVAYIAGQGEDVVAAYNCDMIAYRGTDPAPPDLVIYTNSASQNVATTLSNAIQTYTPGLLQPVVHVENLTGSDHVSFWDHGYKAVCAIEDEAWGDDFCPWYHTCEDRIERYPQDYAVNCAKANLAAVAVTALPVNPTGPYLVMGNALIDDDTIGGSNGNGDGVINPGETIELWVTVRNVGNATATHVSGALSSQSGSVNILNPSAPWNDIPAGSQGTNLTALRFQVAGTALDGEILPFTLTMSYDTGSQPLLMQFPVVAPALSYRFNHLDDTTSGNRTGVLDPGEVVSLTVTLANSGGQGADNVEAVLTSSNPHLHVIDGEAAVASIPSGGQGVLAPAYTVAVSSSAAAGEVIELDLAITAAFGYTATSGFKIKVGTCFYDDVEADGAWSLEAADDDATTGQWVRVDPNGTTYNGQQAQPEDDHTPAPGTDCFVTGQGSVGGAAGEADVDGGKTTLTSPTFDLSHVVDPRLTYWRWYTNNLGNNPNEDYWVVQISSNGGTSWVDLERTTSSANSWQEKTFQISTYISLTNQVVVRYIASDEINGTLVEAAVDDFEISGAVTPVTADDVGRPAALRLDPARPSPTSGAASISFALPAASAVTLKLFSVDGRLVRTLADGRMGAGVHRVLWDGRGDSGFDLAPGLYFCRMDAAGQRLTRRLVLVR